MFDDQNAKAERIKMLRASGFNADEAQMIEDISFHAAKEAVSTLVRITDTAPSLDMKIVSRISAMKFVETAAHFAVLKIGEQMLNSMETKEATID